MVQTASQQDAGTLGIISAAALIWISSAAFRQLQRALNFIWGLKPRRGYRGGVERVDVVVLCMVLAIGLLFVGFALSHLALGFVRGYLDPWTPILGKLMIWSGLNLIILPAFVVVVGAGV